MSARWCGEHEVVGSERRWSEVHAAALTLGHPLAEGRPTEARVRPLAPLHRDTDLFEEPLGVALALEGLGPFLAASRRVAGLVATRVNLIDVVHRRESPSPCR